MWLCSHTGRNFCPSCLRALQEGSLEKNRGFFCSALLEEEGGSSLARLVMDTALASAVSFSTFFVISSFSPRTHQKVSPMRGIPLSRIWTMMGPPAPKPLHGGSGRSALRHCPVGRVCGESWPALALQGLGGRSHSFDLPPPIVAILRSRVTSQPSQPSQTPLSWIGPNHLFGSRLPRKSIMYLSTLGGIQEVRSGRGCSLNRASRSSFDRHSFRTLIYLEGAFLGFYQGCWIESWEGFLLCVSSVPGPGPRPAGA